MKKWYTVGLLVLVVVFAVSMLVACESDEETTTTMAPTTEAPPTTEAAAGAITTDMALDYEGQEVTVTGEVVGIADLGEGIGKILIQLDSTEDGEGANGVILYADKDKFDLTGLEGKTVNITGMVSANPFELKADIALTDPSQIEVVGDAAGGAANDIGVYFTDLGNGVVQIMDVPAPGMEFPIHTGTDDYAATIEAFDADGNSLGMLDLPEAAAGELDYSSVDGLAKIVVTTFSGVPFEYMIP